MSSVEEGYALAEMRDLLYDRFERDAGGLWRVFAYTANARLQPLRHKLTRGQSLEEMADIILEYCEDQLLFPELLEELERAPAGVRPGVPYQAPRPLDGFVGREGELERLSETLRPGARAAITGLTGMGGLGKTELAKLAASRVADRFGDGVLWADCGQQGMGTIASLWAAAYGIQIPGDDDVSRAAAWRGIASGKEALLIFDNVQPGQEVEPLFPPLGPGAVLITTRHAGHPALRGAGRLALEQFTPGEAAVLAAEVLGPEAAGEQAQEAGRTFELLDYLPLGVAVALQVAADAGWSLGYLNGQLEAAGALAVLGEEESLRQSLQATFDTSWANLPGELQETFGALAPFNQGPSFDTAALAAVLELEEPQAQRRLRRLARRSLLVEEGAGRWSLHALLREYAAGRAAEDEAAQKPMACRMAAHYVGVAREAYAIYLDGDEGVLEGLALFDLEWPHIAAGQAWAAARAESDDEAARLCCDYPDAAADLLALRLHPREWIDWLEAGASAARHLGDRAAEGRHLGNLGLAYAGLGQVGEAIEFHERALAISRQTGDRWGEAAELDSLGSTYYRLGELQRATEYYQGALAIERETGNWRGEAGSLSNLGNVYAELEKLDKAIECYEGALDIAREIGDRQGEGISLGNLGLAYAALGQAGRAIEYCEDALAIAREMGDQYFEGVWLGALGEAYEELGEVAQAKVTYEQAIVLAREIGDREGEAIRCWNLGLMYEESEPARAVALMEVLVAYEQEIGHAAADEDARRVEGIRARL